MTRRLPRGRLAAAIAVVVAVVGAPTGAAGAAPVTAAVTATTTPGPAGAPEYWFDTWHVEDLWADGARGQGVTIAEIDTGVSAELPELSGRILRGKDFGRSGDGRVDRELNAFGHGTAMASIMVARPGLLGITGLAPGARILPIAVPLNGTSDSHEPDKLPDAIRWGVDHGAKIVSMSLGGKQQESNESAPCPATEQAAIFYALSKGAVVIASVGNTGPSANTVESPGSCLGVVSVGSVDESDVVADFSSREPYLTLVAPGVNIPSLGRDEGDAFSGDGTSQSAALVSAALALAWSKYPSLGGEQVITRLLATLDDHRSAPSESYGYGVLDAESLVTGTVPAGSPNPVYAAAAPFRARAAALESIPGPGTPPAATAPAGSEGPYAVSRAPRLTPQVQYGAVVAGAALLALVLLLAVGRRRHRARGALAAAGVGESWTAETDTAGGPADGPAARPRPRPDRPPPAD